MVLLMLMDVICGMVEMSVDLTLIFAAGNTDQFAMFLSTSKKSSTSDGYGFEILDFQE